MKIFAISDLHLATAVEKPMNIFGENWDNHLEKIRADWVSKVEDDDLVLLCGDLSWAMRMGEALPDIDQLKDLKGHKIILRGNHDYWWNTISQVRSNLPEKFYALQNDVLRFDNILICGTRGWTVPDLSGKIDEEDKRIYARETERMKLSLKALQKVRTPADKVICMMHFPPFNAMYEDSEFTKLIIENDIGTVVYGHLHGTQCRAEKTLHKFGAKFYLTSCDIVDCKLVELEL